MDAALVYAKTPKGATEIATRAAQLPIKARRVLIMIDGRRSVDELAILVRPGELGEIIALLESAGLIQRMHASLDVPTITGRDSGFPLSVGADDRDAMTLDEAKRRAVRELTDRLGPDADMIAVRLESCRTIEEFRDRVREAERVVSATLGPQAAQEYLRSVRRRG